MTRQQTVTVNVHHPQVERITRQTDGKGNPGMLAITLGNGEYHGNVTVMLTDEEWFTMQKNVNRFLSAEAMGNDPSGDQYCPECSYIGVDRDDMTEHVFGNHPDAVAR